MASKGAVFGLLLPLLALSASGQEVPDESQETTTNVSQNFTLEQEGDLSSREGSLKRSVDKLGYFFHPEEQSYEDDKIAGGAYASDGQFPFMAVVHRLIGQGGISVCGGTIISERWVLTAGHCLARQPRRFLVVFGVINKAGIGYDYNQGPGVSMMTTYGALHPEYGLTSNDIGLLYMPYDIPFTSRIQPISLAGMRYTRHTFADWNAYIIGWGKDHQYGGAIQNLKYSQIPIIANRECSHYWDVNSHNICTAPSAGTNTCEGDSGGPLVVVDGGRYLQVGIVSYGDENCPSSRPGVYTRISAYAQWIYQVTGIAF